MSTTPTGPPETAQRAAGKPWTFAEAAGFLNVSVKHLRHLADAGALELLGGPATHPFAPMLLPEVRTFALETGLADATIRLGTRPAGIWAPECGYAPGMAAEYAAAGVSRFLVDGPALHGQVLGGGADWQYVRNDGVTVAEATYLLRTHDGVLIQVRNRGLRHGPAEVVQRLMEGDDVDPGEYYFRTSPTFLVPPGAYDWLNRDVFVATGARHARAIELWFYRVT